MQTMRSGMSFGGRIMTPGVKGLIIANAAVFVLQTLVGRSLDIIGYFGFVPHTAVFDLQLWRFFTYMFLHGGLIHIGFNMFALWMFGSQIEARWGTRTFLVFYFVCGLGASLTYGLFNLVGMESYVIMIGASGAVMGVLVAYGMTYPNAIILFMLVIPMKAKYFVILLALIDLMSIPGGGSVAHLAHIGGFVTGFIFMRLTVPSAGGGFGFGAIGSAWRRYRTKRRMRVVRPEDRPRGGNGGYDVGERGKPGPRDQQKIDAILDKISREGLQSLTDEEQEILRRAGRK